MSETDVPRLVAAQQQVPHLHAPSERTLRNAHKTWDPSRQTLRLASEAERTLFGELIAFVPDRKCRSFEATLPLVAFGVQDRVPKALSAIVVEYLALHFDGGPEPIELTCCQRHTFGSLLDTDLHLLKLIEVNEVTFWKRVVWCFSRQLLTYFEHSVAASDKNWKCLGIELKLAQLIEQQDPRYWHVEKLEETMVKAAPFVRHLNLEQLTPFPTVEPLENYETYNFHNPPDALCHHGSLSVLGHLVHLTTLSLVFGVKNWTKPYRDSYSKCSLADVEQLGMALQGLVELKNFSLSNSRLDAEKLTVLVRALTHLRLETLRLSYCQLGEGCGGVLGRFLSRFGPTLRSLDLSGNRLDARELDQFGPGLGVYQGTVDRLDLSYNPVGQSGVLLLGGAIKGTRQLSELNFTGCPMGTKGAFRIIQLLSFHAPLRKLIMNCIPICSAGQAKLLQVLRENRHIEDLQCRGCNLPREIQKKVGKFLTRNAKLKHKHRVADEPSSNHKPATGATSRACWYELERKVFGPTGGT
ncbi:uncharacterized protein LOC131215793 [Anopheles bellator]|uniref:uncharacterized protein LOC131215793 n=1 Tax=Anopheles bellator TaxID=139047 RepID=UPI002649480B|nr:uncharacterized protein LOC131215793 [Anopheles bellator]